MVILLGLLDVKRCFLMGKRSQKRGGKGSKNKHKKEKLSQKKEGEEVEIESVEVAREGRA